MKKPPVEKPGAFLHPFGFRHPGGTGVIRVSLR